MEEDVFHEGLTEQEFETLVRHNLRRGKSEVFVASRNPLVETFSFDSEGVARSRPSGFSGQGLDFVPISGAYPTWMNAFRRASMAERKTLYYTTDAVHGSDWAKRFTLYTEP